MVYVDNAQVLKYGYVWFHLMADSIQELHEFAADIGVPARAFHRGARHPHYDVTEGQRNRALRNGAVTISAREAVHVGRKIVRSSKQTGLDCRQLSLFT